jgi:phospholipase/carboxylesterase
MPDRDPHANAPIREVGAPLSRAKAVVVALHGRGATAQGILSLADVFVQPDVAWLAPQAAGHAWYPYSFLAPLHANEPHLSSALAAVDRTVQHALDAGFSHERIVVLGFSQGGCLASEYVARNARRYGGVIAYSGGLIGNDQVRGVDPPADKRFDYEGGLDGTPVFLGCSDRDPHIPVDRVHTTTEVFTGLGAHVDERIYPGMGHTVNDDEIVAGRAILARVQGLEG